MIAVRCSLIEKMSFYHFMNNGMYADCYTCAIFFNSFFKKMKYRLFFKTALNSKTNYYTTHKYKISKSQSF